MLFESIHRRLTISFAILVSVLANAYGLQPDEQRSTENLFASAHASQEKGDFANAEKLYREFLHFVPQSAEGHANLGVVYARQGKIDQAIREYQNALRLNPSLRFVYLNLGIAFFRKQDFSSAVRPLEKFLSLSPQNQQARQLLGLSHVELGHFEKAIGILSPLRATGDPEVLFALGSCYVRLNKADEAEQVFRSLLSSEPNSPRIHYLLGQAYVGVNKLPQAEGEFKQVQSLDPKWPQIDLLLGAVVAQLGKFDEAERDFRLELQFDPDSFGANFALGALLNKLRRYPEALPLLEKARRLESADSEALYELARAYWKEGRNREAWRAARAAVRADSQNRRAHLLLGQLARESGQEQLARREFAAAGSISKAESNRDILRFAELSRKDRGKKQP